MWKLVLVLVVPLAGMLVGWVKGRRSGSCKLEAENVTLRNQLSKAKSDARVAAEEADAVANAVHAGAVARHAQDGSAKATEDLERQLEHASDTGDIDALLGIAKAQYERAEQFRRKLEDEE